MRRSHPSRGWYNGRFSPNIAGGISFLRRDPLPTSNALRTDTPPLRDLRGMHVLVVEDQWQVAMALKSLLEVHGLQVSGPVAKVADALLLAANNEPDFAIVDMNLKGEMAYRLIERLHDQGIRVVVVSGYAVLPGLTEKAAAVLRKPFNGPELLAAMRGALASEAVGQC